MAFYNLIRLSKSEGALPEHFLSFPEFKKFIRKQGYKTMKTITNLVAEPLFQLGS